jgi:ATP-dependent helicase/nuclease subunit B
MGWRWLQGPPGAGKTAHMLARAREAADAGERVAWIGLPAQRDHILRRLAAAGPILGVSFYTFQQLALLQLGAAGSLRPQILGTARLALVAEALAEIAGALPTPGEASLFTHGIAEVKRYGLDPAALQRLLTRKKRVGVQGLSEAGRLLAVYRAYERIKGGAWDDDDVRNAARAAATDSDAASLRRAIPADRLIVDGWRELLPGDLTWLRELARGVAVEIATALAPAGVATEPLAPTPSTLSVYRFANPIAEVRWVLRAVARDLAAGIDPRDLAVIAPEGTAAAMRALAAEFGVVLAPEAPRALVDLPFGRLLVDLLELGEQPTAGRLLAIPALAALGRRALLEGLAGRAAILQLAREEEMVGVWEDWQRALTPTDPPLDWARSLLALAADLHLADGSASPEVEEGERVAVARAQEAALRRAQEASRIAAGEGFRAWWLALLRAASVQERPRPGVALIDPQRASGRRYRRAYLVGAVAGAFSAGEREDYFFPEEARAPWEAFDKGLMGELPRRHRGLDGQWREEWRTRADALTITHAEADRERLLAPDVALLARPRGDVAPELPSASPLEGAVADPFEALPLLAPVAGRPLVETLRRAEQCSFAAWAASLVEGDPRAPWWERARRLLRAPGTIDEGRLRSLRGAFPLLAPWLDAHGEGLLGLQTGVRLEGGGVVARVDALRSAPSGVTLVRFLLPGEAPLGVLDPTQRWNELWAADLLRSKYPARCPRVDILAWPLAGEPQSVTPDGVDRGPLLARRRRLVALVAAAAQRWREHPPTPKPDHHCRRCAVADLCRHGSVA